MQQQNMEQQKLNNYIEITGVIDYTNEFHSFSLGDIKKYQDWFSDNKPERLKLINRSIFHVEFTELNKNRLNTIEVFLQNNIFTIPKSKEELKHETEKVPLKYRDIVKLDAYHLSNYSKSLCFDVGVLIGEWLIQLDSKIEWKFEDDINFVYYGNAVLKKKKCKLEACPIHIVRNFVLKMARGNYTDGMLIKGVESLIKGYKIDYNIEEVW